MYQVKSRRKKRDIVNMVGWYRNLRRFSRRELCEIVDISEGRLIYIERSHKNLGEIMTYDETIKLSEALQVSVKDLIKDFDDSTLLESR